MFINVNIASYFNLGIYTIFTVFIPATFIFLFGRYRVKDLINEFNLYDKKIFVFAAFCWCLMLISSVRAYQLNSISVVAPLLTLTAIFNAGYEFLINKNKSKLFQKIVAFLFILLGVILIKG